MIRATSVVALLAWTCLCVSLGAAQTATTSSLLEVFEAANVAASRGDSAAAIRDYERLVAAGVRDEDVYFNLGTAYAQAGEYPLAILNFERALDIHPNDTKTADNLRAAEQVLEEKRAEAEGEAVIQRSNSVSDAIYSVFTEDALAYTLILANFAFFGCLALSWSKRRRAARTLAAAVLLAAVLVFSAVGLATKSGAFRDGLRAVVVADRASLREAPDAKARNRGLARGGDRAWVTGTDGDFVKLRVISGAEGWTEASAVGLIDPDERLH